MYKNLIFGNLTIHMIATPVRACGNRLVKFRVPAEKISPRKIPVA
jgi:hypothetical protein